ncbi:stage IV sporulation protein B [Clostridium amylolyticum]|uniref:Stage IV sporulation protein B n=1 Tax=Clostridium amylolyticum TaxID=1121298 RepID=A0A1M6KGG3_9CLOT|nr:SpoIVB peptidase [Clostridium amylolyticum]SHJ57970.1 stage IV sporulation protein B [Clostridium amylolyticum]
MNKLNKSRVKSIITPIIAILFTILPFNATITKNIEDNNHAINYQNNKGNKKLFSFINKLNKNYEAQAAMQTFYNDLELIPGGKSVGVKISTKGVLVVGYAEVSTERGNVESPGSTAGIQVGDSILKVDEINIESSSNLMNIINKSDGKELNILIDRDGENIIKKLSPIKSSEDSKYKIGLWVRDSTAGVGTLTFYEPKSKKFGALGHPITDVDTNSILKISKGVLINSSIISVKKGEKGNPGELKGIFINEDVPLAKVTKNTECGIFGVSDEKLIDGRNTKPLKVASQNEIKEGKAQIITTIDENGPKYYDIEIVKLLPQDAPSSKSMIIKVTDSELLKKTGGIVQGMSGSPIIQNNKIVGAVTHVLINKPDTGYGIYIHWMIKDGNILSK